MRNRDHAMPRQRMSESVSTMRMQHREIINVSKQNSTNFKLPLPLERDLRDENGCVLQLDILKRVYMEEAVDAVCLHFERAIHSLSLSAYLKTFKQFLRTQIRGNMYAVIASRPVMEVSQYVELYWNTYNQLTDTVFIDFMLKRFFEMKSDQVETQRMISKMKTKAVNPIDNENKYLDLINLHEPFKLDDAKEMSNSNCWYIDHILDRVLFKAYNNVMRDNTEALENDEKPTKTNFKVENYKDLSGMSMEQLMAKIKVNEDMDSIATLVDIRLARLLPQIKNAIILSGIRGLGRHIPSCTKRLRLKRHQLKSCRKLYYVTVATHKKTTEILLNTLNLVAVCSGHTKELYALGYEQNILCTPNHRLYTNLLARHMKNYKGHKMFAVKTFPEENDEPTQTKVDDLEHSPVDLYMEKEWSLFESSISYNFE